MKETGKATMADIGGKPATAREAVAEGRVFLSVDAWEMVRGGGIPKGDVFGVARVAGILAAKETPRILPLCHPIPLSSVRVDLSLPGPGEVRVEATVRTVAPTGVEMEALTAVAAAALCVYDMVKPVDRSIEISGIRLLRKTGGKSGDYVAAGASRRSRAARSAASRKSAARSGRGPKRSR
ncbi:MAG: cyclic pyranopterin monophosphate synthase MoaC [Deltaproteobacteria bacterium]